MRAFREADAADFFGRDRLVNRFIEVLGQPGSAGRLLAVVGPSGSGKSSVVRSGLVPRLRGGGVTGSAGWFITTMIPGAPPLRGNSSRPLSRVAVHQPGPLVEIMRSDERGITRAVNQILPDEEGELLVVIDQFEELFTHGDSAETAAFLDGLVAAVREPRTRLRVVVTIRADFWDRPLRHPALATRLESATVTVSPLATDELEAAIVEPVRRQGATYEPGLVARIMADVRDQPGALPLLQYALTELFDTNVSGLLRTEAYDEIGGLTGALAGRAEQTFDALSAAQQAATRRLFGRLVTPGDGTEDTRRRVWLAELGDDPDARAVIDAFGDARLLVFDHDPATREPTVEIAHEALIRSWPRLREWLNEDREGLRVHRHLTATTMSWLASGGDDGELYRGGRLEAAQEYASNAHLTPDEQAFLDAGVAASAAEVERERRRIRRLRRLVAATAAVAGVAIVAGLVAIGQQRRADDSAAEAREATAQAEAEAERADASAGDARAATELAETEADRANEAAEQAEQQTARAEAALADAEIVTLISRSATLVDENPTASLLLAAEAYDRDPSNRTTAALATALGARTGETTRIELDPIPPRSCADGDDTNASYLRISNDGWIGWYEDGLVSALDPVSGTTGVHTAQPDSCGTVDWAYADGPILHTFANALHVERQPGSGDIVELLELADGAEVTWATTSAGRDGVVAATVTTANGDRDIYLFGRDNEPIAAPLDLDTDPFVVGLSRSGNLGFARDVSVNELQGNVVQLIDTAQGEARWRVELPAQITDAGFNPSETLVAFPDLGGTVHVYDTATGALITRLTPGSGAVQSLSFLDDQRLVLTTAEGAEVWNVDNVAGAEHEMPISGAVGVRALGPGRFVVVRGGDELVVVDLERSGLGLPLAPVPPGARVYLEPGGIAAVAAVAAAEGELINLRTGESETHPLAIPDAGPVVGISPRQSTGDFLAFTLDGAIAEYEDGELTEVVYLADSPTMSIRGAEGHGSPDGGSRVAIRLSDLDRPDSEEVFLVDLITFEVVFSVVGECPCVGATPTPDLQGLVLDTGDAVTVHTPDGGARALPARAVDPSEGPFQTGVDAERDRLLRTTPDGVVELIDMNGGPARAIAEFAVDVSSLSFVDAGRAIAITAPGDVWLIDTDAGERIGLIWEGGAADATAGDPVVSVEGDVVYVPTPATIVEIPLSPIAWRDLACELAGRELTADEWNSLVPGDEAPRPICAAAS